MMSWLDGITDSMDNSLSKLQETVKQQGSPECCSPWGHQESDTTERLSNMQYLQRSYNCNQTCRQIKDLIFLKFPLKLDTIDMTDCGFLDILHPYMTRGFSCDSKIKAFNLK